MVFLAVPTLTRVRIRHQYGDFNLQAFTIGSVIFTPQTPSGITDDHKTLLPSPIEAFVDSNGMIDVTMPASNDPDWSPNYFVYQVKENLPRGRTFYIEVPYNTPNPLVDGLWLDMITPITQPTQAVSTFVNLTTFQDLVSRVSSIESDGGGGGGGTVPTVLDGGTP
jgi:hypothetical protein